MNMRADPSNKSLVQILIDRHDTGFEGYSVDEKTAERYRENGVGGIYRDETGDYFSHSHDYIATKKVDGKQVGIIVGDTDGRNCMDHPYSHLPHPIGLYVREDYRSRGIASELINGYMDFVDGDKCVIDCNTNLVPFYEQFDYEIIYLQSYKLGMDPTTVPLPPDSDRLDIDTSNSPEHDVPFITSGESQGHSQDRLDSGTPSFLIRQNPRIGQQCSIQIQMPYDRDNDGRSKPYVLTDTAISEINEITEHHVGQSIAKTDFSTIDYLSPDTARELVDLIYPIVTDESNLTLSEVR